MIFVRDKFWLQQHHKPTAPSLFDKYFKHSQLSTTEIIFPNFIIQKKSHPNAKMFRVLPDPSLLVLWEDIKISNNDFTATCCFSKLRTRRKCIWNNCITFMSFCNEFRIIMRFKLLKPRRYYICPDFFYYPFKQILSKIVKFGWIKFWWYNSKNNFALIWRHSNKIEWFNFVYEV